MEILDEQDESPVIYIRVLQRIRWDAHCGSAKGGDLDSAVASTHELQSLIHQLVK